MKIREVRYHWVPFRRDGELITELQDVGCWEASCFGLASIEEEAILAAINMDLKIIDDFRIDIVD